MEFTSRGYEAPGLAADAVVLNGGMVLLVRRANEPFRGAWALPGGFVEVGETVEAACLRELREETGLNAAIVALLGVFSDPGRDPRGHVVSIAYACTPSDPAACPSADDDAAEAAWFALEALPDLAFDHGAILQRARAWLASAEPDRNG